MTAVAHETSTLVAGMLAVGAASGAADVAINTLAGHAEHLAARPVIARAHATFSLAVVASSLATGVLLSAGLALTATAALDAALMAALSAVLLIALPAGGAPPAERSPAGAAPPVRTTQRSALRPLVATGLVAALAFAAENAHQSWGSTLLTQSFDASPRLAATAPAVFAGTEAAARLLLAPLSRARPALVLVAGGVAATAGSALLAQARTPAAALAGLGLSAVGLSILFPTLLSRALTPIDPHRRGRATSIVSTTAYLGYLAGPAYVGLLADVAGLPDAFVGVAALTALFTAAVIPRRPPPREQLRDGPPSP